MNAGAVRLDDLPVIDTEVLVVGAGPTGLMAGLVLNRRGVPAVVVDRKPGPTPGVEGVGGAGPHDE